MAGDRGVRLRDDAMRKARALLIIDKRIREGLSLARIGEELNISGATVAREIDWAKRKNLVADAEEDILERLVPKAIKAFEAALDNNDTQAALELLKGLNILRKQTAKPIDRPEPEHQEESLEFYVRKINKGEPTSKLAGTNLHDPRRALTAGGAEDSHQGSVLEGVLSDPGAPAAAPAVESDSDENHAPNS
jgi:hypothetical protein